MKIKKIIIIIAFLQFFMQVNAMPRDSINNSLNHRWGKYYSEIYDVELTKPKHMIDRWQWTDHILWFDWNNITSRDGIIFMFESEDRNFLLTCSHDELYNRQSASNTSLQADTSGRYQCSISENYPRAYAAHELEASYGYIKGHKRVSYKVLTLEDFNTYVTVYSGKKVRRWFNADSVYTYPLPAVDVFYREPVDPIESTLKRYVYCTGVIISKNGRAGMSLKLFFTKEGKRNEQKYLRMLRKMIWYRNDDWQFDREKHDRYWREKNNSN